MALRILIHNRLPHGPLWPPALTGHIGMPPLQLDGVVVLEAAGVNEVCLGVDERMVENVNNFHAVPRTSLESWARSVCGQDFSRILGTLSINPSRSNRSDFCERFLRTTEDQYPLGERSVGTEGRLNGPPWLLGLVQRLHDATPLAHYKFHQIQQNCQAQQPRPKTHRGGNGTPARVEQLPRLRVEASAGQLGHPA